MTAPLHDLFKFPPQPSFRKCCHGSFPQSVKLKDDETVVFSWIVFSSRKQRDAVNAKVMKDPRLADMMDPTAMPFDGKRMIWGGFKTLVEL